MTGTIATWFAERGFGFIRPDSGKADIFVHISSVKDETLLEAVFGLSFRRRGAQRTASRARGMSG